MKTTTTVEAIDNLLKLRNIFSGIAFLLLLSPSLVLGQDTVEWFTLGNDYAHTRYTPAGEITPENFSELEVAWE